MTNKGISPAEFRVHNKNFRVDFSPSNYFEKLRFEVILQKLIFWFWRQYGIYFYIQKFKVMDEKILFQVYFYKTYLYNRVIKKTWKSMEVRGVEPTLGKVKNWKRAKVAAQLHFYNPELFTALTALKNNKEALKRVSSRPAKEPARLWFKRKRKHSDNKAPASVLMLNHFFTYFFLHFFKLQSVILAKSLYKVITANPAFKVEHQNFLYRTRYLSRYRWSFDFLFLANYALTFSNTQFLMPFYLAHVVRRFTQWKYAEIFFNTLRKLYYLKKNIRAIKILVNGPYNRHGRTHSRMLKIGDVALLNISTCVLYDTIQWLTPYGAISMKLWIYYSDYLVMEKKL